MEEGPAERIFSAPETDYTKALLSAAFNLTATRDTSIIND